MGGNLVGINFLRRITMEEKFKNLESSAQPKNTMKIKLTDVATGNVDYETEIENTVGLILTQKANMDYKGFAFGPRYAGVYNAPYPGVNNIAIQLYDYNPGVTSDNAYTNLNQYTLNGSINYDAMDTTRNSTFHVYNVLATYSTYSNVLSISTFNVGSNIIVAGDSITQGSNTTTVTTVIDATHIQVASISGWIGQNDAGQTGTSVTAFNYLNATTTSGTQGGVYLPQLSGFQQDRGYTWSYEWGTTQGNGTISSLGFFENGAGPVTYSNGGGFCQVASVSQMATSGNSNWTYAGYSTSGSQYQLRFVSRTTNANNVTIINHNDFSLVAQYTITNPTGTWSPNQHDILYTPVGGGKYYAIISVGNTSFSYKTCAESSTMTFGSTLTASVPVVPGWYPGSGSSVVNWYSWTADETYIYALIYDNSNYQSAILTFDPSTNTVVSVVKNPAGFGGVGGIGDQYLFNVCPVTGKLMTRSYESYVTEWTSITQPATNNFIASWPTGVFVGDPTDFIMHQTTTPTDRLVGCYSTASSTYNGAFFEMTRGSFYTYAQLPTPITKLNTQSLLISYTLNFD
jgi:hypothetical protein